MGGRIFDLKRYRGWSRGAFAKINIVPSICDIKPPDLKQILIKGFMIFSGSYDVKEHLYINETKIECPDHSANESYTHTLESHQNQE